MTRCIVNVATTERYQRGQARLMESPLLDASFYGHMAEPPGSPKHSDVPYAFKAFALMGAALAGHDLLLWADACILPIRSLEPLWERIEREGVWISNNGFTNYEWTADSAYPDLFPEYYGGAGSGGLPWARDKNREVPHVVATAFGLNIRHPKGAAFLAEYCRLASKTRAFCGPWKNTPQTPCGPPDVSGHRHDQTAASVIAWRLGMELTNPPEIFAYKGGETDKTILVADGSYE